MIADAFLVMSMALEIKALEPVPDCWDPVFFSAARKPSAVLVLFVVGDSEEERVLMIRRSTRVGSHRGQIGFPGGRLESQDRSPAETALRETSEELGLNTEAIRVLGVLPALPSLDGSLVFPVVGVIAADDCRTSPDANEVQEVYQVPLRLITVDRRTQFSFNLFGCWRNSFLYDCNEMIVWGLSAEIIAKADLRSASV